MNRFITVAQLLCLAAALSLASASAWAQSTDGLGGTATWQPPQAQEVKTQALKWLESKKVDAAARAKAETIWSSLPAQASEDELLVRVAATYAIADANAAKLVAMCSQPRTQLVVPSQAWLATDAAPPLLVKNLRLLYARWLVQGSLYDEALEQLGGLMPQDVVAPASLLFYQSVANHALLKKEPGLKSIEQLLQGEKSSPRRYVAVARLMQEDLKGLQPDTLDHIARQMSDAGRRLDQGRAGQKVRTVEDGIIAALDKMIKEMEKQQSGGGGGSSSGPGNTMKPSSPASQPSVRTTKASGDVTSKNIGSKAEWGDLPPKEREQIMDSIARDFPPQYRDVIEQYFKRLAAEEGK